MNPEDSEKNVGTKQKLSDDTKIPTTSTVNRHRRNINAALDAEIYNLMTEEDMTIIEPERELFHGQSDKIPYLENKDSLFHSDLKRKLSLSLSHDENLLKISRMDIPVSSSSEEEKINDLPFSSLKFANFGNVETAHDTYTDESDVEESSTAFIPQFMNTITSPDVPCSSVCGTSTKTSLDFQKPTSSTSVPYPLKTKQNKSNFEDFKEYLNHNDTIMFKESGLWTWEVIVIIFGLSIRFGLSYHARRALIEAAKIFAGPEFEHWDVSDYHLSKMFDPPEGVITYCFYCAVCCKELQQFTNKNEIKDKEKVCTECLQNYKLSLANRFDYYIHLDVKYQIESLLSSTVLRDSLFDNLTNIQSTLRDDGEIHDVYDGILYRQLLQKKLQVNCQLLTFIFYTDGAPLFISSKLSFWPIFIVINELPRQLRFRYPLLVGLWIGKKEPTANMMNMFLESFILKVNELSEVGFILTNSSGKDIHFLLKALLCSVDSVARPLLQNMMQFNGYYGCPWCYCKGQYKYGSMHYLLEENVSAERTHDGYLKDMSTAMQKCKINPQNTKSKSEMSENKAKSVNGVKGFSVISKLKDFDMIWSFSRDYLHADLIGIPVLMWSIWTADKNSHIKLSKAQQSQVNERLIRMTPPHEIHRLARPLTDKSKWKATEWRSWLLFYAIPCLKGLLDDYALQHFALFSNSIYTLLQSNITKEELIQAEYDIIQFVGIFEILYGENHVTFNVHTLRHLVSCVRYCGPIWATSTFPSENAIYYMKRNVHSPKGVQDQMAKKSVQRNVFLSLLQEVGITPTCFAFCESLFKRSVTLTVQRCDLGDVILIGRGKHQPLTAEFSKTYSSVLMFERCIFGSMIVNSIMYTRPEKMNDTVFRFKNGKFGEVQNLILFESAACAIVVYFEVSKIILSSRPFENYLPRITSFHSKNLYKIEKRKNEETVLVSDIAEKCIVINVSEGNVFLSTLPNTTEIQ